MSSYATVQDVLNAWPKVHTSAFSHDEIRTQIERASNLIDAELVRRYDVPFASPYPPRIRDLAVDLAMADILYRSADPPPFVQQRITWAMEFLARLRNGEAALVGAEGGEISERSGFDTLTSNTSGYVPVFGAKPSLGERIDPRRGEAEANARGDTYDEEW